jgi:hypothetical protein
MMMKMMMIYPAQKLRKISRCLHVSYLDQFEVLGTSYLNNTGLVQTGHNLFKCVTGGGSQLLILGHVLFVTDEGNFKQKFEMIRTGENQSTKRKFWVSAISSVTNSTCIMYWPGTESRTQKLRDLQLTVWAVTRLPVYADPSETPAVSHKRSRSNTVSRSSGETRTSELSKATWLSHTFPFKHEFKANITLTNLPSEKV